MPRYISSQGCIKGEVYQVYLGWILSCEEGKRISWLWEEYNIEKKDKGKQYHLPYNIKDNGKRERVQRYNFIKMGVGKNITLQGTLYNPVFSEVWFVLSKVSFCVEIEKLYLSFQKHHLSIHKRHLSIHKRHWAFIGIDWALKRIIWAFKCIIWVFRSIIQKRHVTHSHKCLSLNLLWFLNVL